jgi:hypothetical protein
VKLPRTLAAGYSSAKTTAPKPLAVTALAREKGPSQKAEGEEPVVAAPRLGRDVFLYMEPRPALDAPASFAQCASCCNFIPDLQMHGAVRGDRCLLFGTNFPITDDDSCNLYVPWPAGDPCKGCVAHGAEELIGGMRASVKPFDVGYVADTKVTCKRCRQFDFVDSACEAMEELNRKLPQMFDLDEKVSADGCCSMWSAIPLEDPMG